MREASGVYSETSASTSRAYTNPECGIPSTLYETIERASIDSLDLFSTKKDDSLGWHGRKFARPREKKDSLRCVAGLMEINRENSRPENVSCKSACFVHGIYASRVIGQRLHVLGRGFADKGALHVACIAAIALQKGEERGKDEIERPV